MTQEPSPGPTENATSPTSPTSGGTPRLTRTGAVWVATGATLLLLVLLIILMLQNPAPVEISYLGFTGSLPLGLGLLIAAVSGGVLVAVAGVARVMQLRRNVRRSEREGSTA